MTKFYAMSESAIELVDKPGNGNGGETPPLVIWGPGDPRPTLPIAGWDPGTGTWPIPPDQVEPPHVWDDLFPNNPIAEPPWGWGNPPPALPELPKGKLVYGWTEPTGWFVLRVSASVVEGPVPTPSKRR